MRPNELFSILRVMVFHTLSGSLCVPMAAGTALVSPQLFYWAFSLFHSFIQRLRVFLSASITPQYAPPLPVSPARTQYTEYAPARSSAHTPVCSRSGVDWCVLVPRSTVLMVTRLVSSVRDQVSSVQTMRLCGKRSTETHWNLRLQA